MSVYSQSTNPAAKRSCRRRSSRLTFTLSLQRLFDMADFDDDDDMAELFSFGSGDAEPTSADMYAAPPIAKERAQSSDSFLDLLEAEGGGGGMNATGTAALEDEEAMEILSWLEEDGNDLTLEQLEKAVDEAAASTEVSTPVPAPEPEAEPTVVALPPSFGTLAEALTSSESTVEQIRDLASRQTKEIHELSEEQRAELYCRLLCHKRREDVGTSSLADSFQAYCDREQESPPTEWIGQQAAALTPQLAEATARSVESCREDLGKILAYHWSNQGPATEPDPLVAPVAAILLAIVGSAPTASVLLTQIIPSRMPLLALPASERWEAALSLHHEFHMLATYHIPLVVFHLDRYLPGWFWPLKQAASVDGDSDVSASVTARSRNLEKQGHIPPSWLLSQLAGECYGDSVSSLPMNWLLRLWDKSLAHPNPSAMRFFLVVAVLEQAADSLLLLTGDELVAKLQSVLSLTDKVDQKEYVEEWWERALTLQEWTPESVWSTLKKAEDEAVQQQLQRKQERAEAELQAQLEAEAAAYREAQEKKAEEARLRLTRARLVAYYRKHAPEKEANIEKIMTTFAGRFEELDGKLKAKYGEGFNPALKTRENMPNKLFMNRNQGLGRRKDETVAQNPVTKGEHDEPHTSEQVSVLVSVAEVLPVVCWSREAAAARGQQRRRRLTDTKHLKYYLVDSRSEEAAAEQGRFPTAVSLSPETMLDPEKLKENEEMFESLRGAVHIVVMGEGFAALPDLYGHKLNPKLEDLMREDESRTNICALFFVKKGFPFVSVLNGGFAAAHSWLVRNGPTHHLDPAQVLIDYDPESSLFGQLESMQNASATEKAQRKMQNLLDKSMMAMTRRAQQLERFAAEMDTERQTPMFGAFFGGAQVSSGGATAATASDELKLETNDAATPGFRNMFAGLARTQLAEAEKEPPAPVASDSSTANTPNEGESTAAAPTTATTTDTNRFGMFRTKSNDGLPDAKANTTNNMFKGFGAALNSQMNRVAEDKGGMLKRNPFARFGGGGAPVAPKEAAAPVTTTNKPKAGGFGGLGGFRLQAMGRMRSQEELSEESITFGSSEEMAAATSATSTEEAASGAKIQQV